MSLRPNAPAFVPPTRRDSASSVSSLSAETVDTAAAGGVATTTAASRGAVEEEDGGPSVAATTDDVGGVDDNNADGDVNIVNEKGTSSSSSSETEGLRERVKALEGELESARCKNERLSAAAAQAGRLSAALSNVDEDVKRLTNEVERKTEECEEAWALATEREAERDGLAERCESLKEECKAALKKAIATAEELKELKKQNDALDEVRAGKDEELVAGLTARVEELEAAAREAAEGTRQTRGRGDVERRGARGRAREGFGGCKDESRR